MWLPLITLICKSLSSFFYFFPNLIYIPLFRAHFHFIQLGPSSVSDLMDNFCFSVFRFIPEVVPSGPAGGQLVPQFPVSREDNEVLQLYTGQQSTSAPHIHARHVVRAQRASCTRTHGCPLLQRADGKKKRNSLPQSFAIGSHTMKIKEDETLKQRVQTQEQKYFGQTRDSVVLLMV